MFETQAITIAQLEIAKYREFKDHVEHEQIKQHISGLFIYSQLVQKCTASSDYFLLTSFKQ